VAATSSSTPSDKELMALTLGQMQGFSSWPSTSMSLLLAASRLCWHRRGDSLSASAKEPEVFVILTGHVMQFETSPNGIRLRWALRGPRQILGFSSMLSIEESRREHVANDDVVAIHIAGRSFLELLDGDPVRWKDIGRMLVQQERDQIDTLLGQIVGGLSGRLASTIKQLAALHGTRPTGESAIHLQLTQKDLAGLLRVSRQSVNKELVSLETAGVIALKLNAIVILDEFALGKITRSFPSSKKPRYEQEIKNSVGDIALMENFLRMNPAFAPWSREAMNQLLASSKIGRHSPDFVFSTDLCAAGHSFLVISGEAMITHTSQAGEQFNMMMVGPGIFVGVAQIFGGKSHAMLSLVAHSDVMAIHIPTSLIVELLDRKSALWKDMVLMSVRQSAVQVNMVSTQIAGSLRQRAAATIERLAALYGTRAKGESSIRLQVSQATLAAMLQANRQAAHRVLKAIAASGAISLEYKTIAIRDLDALKSYAVEAECEA
jgi:CRP/FNR family cyclic AMP-dependent transcriptional regulator